MKEGHTLWSSTNPQNPHQHNIVNCSVVSEKSNLCPLWHNILIKYDNIPQERIKAIEDQTNWEVCDSFESAADVEASRHN